MEEIKVTVVKYPDRANLVLRYIDPITRKQKTKSAETANENEAIKAAGKWEDELREGRYHAPSKITWEHFRERYENEVLPSLKATTATKVDGVFNAVETYINPKLLRDVTADRISHLQAKLRSAGRAESTIAGHLAHLRAALQWGVSVGMLPVAPKVTKLRRAKSSKVMKGRPILLEEFERMLDAVPKALQTKHPYSPDPVDAKPEVVASWKHYLRGLWLSGLRLEESLELYWDRDDKLCVDLAGKRPMLRIPADLEKGNKDRILPVAPEFAEFLLATPAAERTGPVFNPQPIRTKGPRLLAHRVGEIVSAIGKAAGVKVRTDTKQDEKGKPVQVVKFASAHDLRRSFGERWATRVMPQVLMVLMRHETIDTTMKFYVGRNAETAADALWDAHSKLSGNNSGNNDQKTTRTTETRKVAKRSPK